MSSTLAALEADLHDQPKNPLRPEQRKDWEDERTRLNAIVTQPDWVGGDKTGARHRLKELSRLLDAQTPKRVDAERANRIKVNADRMLKEEIVPAMLPRVVMRRNPAGAVDDFNKRENSRAVKHRILAWKRAMWALDPDTPDQDHTNLEKHRPDGDLLHGTTFMADAQIPGHFAMTPLAKEHWPLGDATIATALKQTQRMKESAAKARAAKVTKRAERLAQEQAADA